jgi:hypothetical protein
MADNNNALALSLSTSRLWHNNERSESLLSMLLCVSTRVKATISAKVSAKVSAKNYNGNPNNPFFASLGINNCGILLGSLLKSAQSLPWSWYGVVLWYAP